MKRQYGKTARRLSALAAGVSFALWVLAAWRKRLVLEAIGQQVLDRQKQRVDNPNDTEETEVPHGQ